jgi:hypothetical protein
LLDQGNEKTGSWQVSGLWLNRLQAAVMECEINTRRLPRC